MTNFSRILIANRGEIACRIAATAKRMGIYSVAVFSDADRHARHVQMADEARYIGPARAADSYLRADHLIRAAQESGAQAIHPGYGFLSENADFAQRCADAGIVFIGPPIGAIRAMGSKAESKTLMARAGVPLVPGWHGSDTDDAALAIHAAAIGYPVLIKASAGGGGRGMRVVQQACDLAEQLTAARRESLAAFGDSRLLLEKYLDAPRHIEVQIFADHHGNTLSLFERDCSIQRRHQKIIEEAPAPGITAALRAKLTEAAILAARTVSYVGAGTVEFIMQDGIFYFMEMNTRLQVEHPVTEMITGLDLVELQFRVAAGEKLPFTQADLRIDGHAIEARLCAEDPARDFMPSIGRIRHLREPANTATLRIDSGITEGAAITPFYDPLLAKIIVHGTDRLDALRQLHIALNDYEIGGIATNLGLLRGIVSHADFAAERFDTGFIPRHWADILPPAAAPSDAVLAAAALAAVADTAPCDPSPWAVGDGFRIQGAAPRLVTLGAGDAFFEIAITGTPTQAIVRIDDREFSGYLTQTASAASLYTDTAIHHFTVRVDAPVIMVIDHGVAYEFRVIDPMASLAVDQTAGSHLKAPIPARITALRVSPGDVVAKGQILLVLEAMKMEIPLTAPRDGTIAEILRGAGDMVAEGEELVTLAAEA